jgi:predicted Holliday junction resolvase-like endonuclease
MNQKETIVFLCLLSVGLIACVIAYLYFKKKFIRESTQLAISFQNNTLFKTKVEEFRKEIATEYQNRIEIEKIRLTESYIEDALKRSKSVTKGKITEHLAPFLVTNWFKPSEIVFIGSPIDMISFSNIETEDETTLDFIEIKTGNSSLNKKQKLIRNAIQNNRVYYRIINLE